MLGTTPVGSVDGLNLYMYVRGNPIKLNDPSGNAGEEEISIGGLIEKGKQYIEEKYNESINSSIEYVQTEINQIQEKVKNGEDLSFSEKAFFRHISRTTV